MKGSKGGVIAYLLVVSLFILSSCGGPRKHSPLKIGLAVNLSGREGELGGYARDGAFLAASEINRNGGVLGRRVEVLVEDNANTASGVIKADMKLLEKGVVAIIGHHNSWSTFISYTYLKEKDVIQIAPYAATTLLDNLDDNMFRLIPSNSIISLGLGKVINSARVERLLVVYDISNRDYTEDLFVHLYPYLKVKLVRAFRFSSRKPIDWNFLFSLYRSLNPDGLLIIASPVFTALIADRLYDEGYRGKVFLTPWSHTGRILDLYFRGLEGAKVVVFFNPGENPKRIEKIREGLKEHVEEDINLWNTLAYDAVKVICRAVGISGSIDAKSLKKALLSTNFDTVYGRIRFSKYGDINVKIYEAEIKNREFVYKKALIP